MQLFGYLCLFLALFATVLCESDSTNTDADGLEGKLTNLLSKLKDNVEERELGNADVDDTEEKVQLDDVVEKGLADGEATETDGEVTTDDQDVEARGLPSSSVWCRRSRLVGTRIECSGPPCNKCKRCSKRRVCVRYDSRRRRCISYGYQTYNCRYYTCYTRGPCRRVCVRKSYYQCL